MAVHGSFCQGMTVSDVVWHVGHPKNMHGDIACADIACGRSLAHVTCHLCALQASWLA